MEELSLNRQSSTDSSRSPGSQPSLREVLGLSPSPVPEEESSTPGAPVQPSLREVLGLSPSPVPEEESSSPEAPVQPSLREILSLSPSPVLQDENTSPSLKDMLGLASSPSSGMKEALGLSTSLDDEEQTASPPSEEEDEASSSSLNLVPDFKERDEDDTEELPEDIGDGSEEEWESLSPIAPETVQLWAPEMDPEPDWHDSDGPHPNLPIPSIEGPDIKVEDAEDVEGVNDANHAAGEDDGEDVEDVE